MKIAICENDREESEFLKSLVLDILGDHNVSCEIFSFEQGEELLESELDYQMVFLDIMLDGRDGVDIGNEIYRRNRQIKIIFQTNFDEYYKEALNRSHAFAYLEKPIEKEELKEQLEELLKDTGDKQGSRIAFEHVILNKDGIYEETPVASIAVRDILYFEYIKRQKQVRIKTEKSEYFYKTSMHALEERMCPFGFEICSRGILVNLGRIAGIQGYTVRLSTGDTIPLSQRRAVRFKERLSEFIHTVCGIPEISSGGNHG